MSRIKCCFQALRKIYLVYLSLQANSRLRAASASQPNSGMSERHKDVFLVPRQEKLVKLIVVKQYDLYQKIY